MMTGQSFTILNGFRHDMDWEKTCQDICIFLVWYAGKCVLSFFSARSHLDAVHISCQKDKLWNTTNSHFHNVRI